MTFQIRSACSPRQCPLDGESIAAQGVTMMRTGFEDLTRPRAVTLAAKLVLVQTALWIAALTVLVLSLQSGGLSALREPVEGWLLPIRYLVWHLLKLRFAEALAISFLAAAMLKRQAWARRLLEVAVLVRGLLPLPVAVIVFSQGPLVFGRYPWRDLGFAWLPVLLLTLPMPVILRLLEAPGNSVWFRGLPRASKEPERDRAPTSEAPASLPAHHMGIPVLRVVLAVVAILATAWLYRIWTPLDDALRLQAVRMERQKPRWSRGRAVDGDTVGHQFAFELENTSWRSIVLTGGHISLLSPDARLEVHGVGMGMARPIAPAKAWTLDVTVYAPPREGFVVLETCYGDKWAYRANTGQTFVFALESSAGPDLLPASETDAARARKRALEYRMPFGAPAPNRCR